MSHTVNRITLTSIKRGTYQCDPEALDLMIAKYLPASLRDLEAEIASRGLGSTLGISSITEGLMILAEYDGYATN